MKTAEQEKAWEEILNLTHTEGWDLNPKNVKEAQRLYKIADPKIHRQRKSYEYHVKKLTKKQQQKAKQDYKKGKQVREIAEEFNCGLGTVYNALGDIVREEQQKKQRKLEMRNQEVMSLLRDGTPRKRVAELMGLSLTTVRKIWIDEGGKNGSKNK